jgi:hypothetical protein
MSFARIYNKRPEADCAASASPSAAKVRREVLTNIEQQKEKVKTFFSADSDSPWLDKNAVG